MRGGRKEEGQKREDGDDGILYGLDRAFESAAGERESESEGESRARQDARLMGAVLGALVGDR